MIDAEFLLPDAPPELPEPAHPAVNLCPYVAQPLHGPATCRLAEHGLYALLRENARLRELLTRANAFLVRDGTLAREIDAVLNAKPQ